VIDPGHPLLAPVRVSWPAGSWPSSPGDCPRARAQELTPSTRSRSMAEFSNLVRRCIKSLNVTLYLLCGVATARRHRFLPGGAGSQPPRWQRCVKEHRVMVGIRHDRAGAVRLGSRKTEGRRAATAGMPALAAVITFALVLAGCSSQSSRPSGAQAAAGVPALALTTFAGYSGQLPLPGAPRLTVNALTEADEVRLAVGSADGY